MGLEFTETKVLVLSMKWYYMNLLGGEIHLNSVMRRKIGK